LIPMLADWHNKDSLGQSDGGTDSDSGETAIPSINQVAAAGKAADLKPWILPFGAGGLLGLLGFFLLKKRLPKLGAGAVAIGIALVTAGIAKKAGL
jgi:hypothetical protein